MENLIYSLMLQRFPSLFISFPTLRPPTSAFYVNMAPLPPLLPPHCPTCSIFSCPSRNSIRFLSLCLPLVFPFPLNLHISTALHLIPTTQPCKWDTANKWGKPWCPGSWRCWIVCLSPALFNSALCHAPHCSSKFRAPQDQKLCLLFALPLPYCSMFCTQWVPQSCRWQMGITKALTASWTNRPQSGVIVLMFLLTSKVRAESQSPPKMSWWSYNDTVFVYKSF